VERNFFNENYDEEDGESPEMEQFVKASKQDIMDVMHMELIEKEINSKLLEQAQGIARSDVFWYFRNNHTKVRRIERIYKKLKKMASEE